MLIDFSEDVTKAFVLIVDDMEVNISMLRGVLSKYHIQCDDARNGFEALKRVCEKDYDLILMDYIMPEMDGLKTTEIIRAMGGKFSEIPIIALTGSTDGDAEEIFIKGGMNDYLPKTVDTALLTNALMKWLPPWIISDAAIHTEICDTEYTAVLRLADKIEGLDIELGLSHIGGIQDAYERSLRILKNDIPVRCAKLPDMLNNDFERFGIEVHGLKGVLAMSGHMGLSNMAKELEDASKNNDVVFCAERLPRFVAELKAFGGKLIEIFEGADTGEKEKGSRFKLGESVKSIKAFLEEFDVTGALEALQKINKYSFGVETDKSLKKAIEALEEFDFDRAAEIIGLLDV